MDRVTTAQPILVDLYNKVAEDQGALLEVLQRIFVCQQATIVEKNTEFAEILFYELPLHCPPFKYPLP